MTHKLFSFVTDKRLFAIVRDKQGNRWNGSTFVTDNSASPADLTVGALTCTEAQFPGDVPGSGRYALVLPDTIVKDHACTADVYDDVPTPGRPLFRALLFPPLPRDAAGL